MTGDEKKEVYKAFNRLLLVMPHRWKTVPEKSAAFEVYLDSLKELSVDAIKHGERTLRIEGTIDNWFPTPPEWFDAAAEYEVKELQRPIAGLLMASPEVIESDLAATREARDLFLAECREKGFSFVEGLVEAIPVRHPSEDTEAPWCGFCGDSGMRAQGDGAGPCGCIPDNPRIRAAAIQHQRLARLKRRGHRAAALQPARSNQNLLSPAQF